MDQQAIHLKKLYTKALFPKCFVVTSATNLTLGEFWRKHDTILTYLRIIDKCGRRQGGSSRTVQSAWKKLWPRSVAERDLEGFEDEPVSVVEDAVSLGKSMGLGMDGDDVEELAEAHSTALTTEEFPDLQREQQLEAAEELSSEEEGREAIPPSLIRKCLGNGEKCTVFLRNITLTNK